jgi:thiosulfate/3-mercaptopyruvate sulfurtransferase
MSTATFDATAQVSPDWIASHLGDPSVRVVEIDVSPAAYGSGHIPGAVFWNAYGDLRPVAYQPVSGDGFAALLARSGIGPDTTVVFYGYAAYLGYWLMRSYGHSGAFFMDGSRERWLESGRAWSTTALAPVPAAAPYPLGSARSDVVTMEEAVELIGDPDTVLLDVRSREEYCGERFWPSGATEGAGRAGRIPGAVWLSADIAGAALEDVRAACEAASVGTDRNVVVYCTIGNRASMVWFVLTQLLGYQRVSVYYGSWAEWGTAPDTPVERSVVAVA